jgi:glucose/arabinose dehydrogenase
MKKSGFFFTSFLPLAYFLYSCTSNPSTGNNSISLDTAAIAKGKDLFNRNCVSCHAFSHDDIGPKLGGITADVSTDWLLRFIKNPQEVISSGDQRAGILFKKYKSVMPSFAFLKEEDLRAIISFLNTQKSADHPPVSEDRNAIANPITEKIKLSGLVVDLEHVVDFPSSNKGTFPKTRITKLTFQPGTFSLFVNDLRGKLYKLKRNKPTVYLDMVKLKPKFIDEPGLATGFGSFAFHPGFETNGLLYTTHTEAPGSGKADNHFPDSIEVALQWVLTEWKIANPADDTLKGTERELLRLNMVTGAHGVQEITFNPLAKPGSRDYGLLYIGIGDGASVQVGYPFLTHSKENLLGSILRIDPLGNNSANGQYGIPPNNPFVHEKDTKTRREIYAYGFRNPHRITWTLSGEMLACNIGQANIEAIDLISPGADYGWPIREGSFAFNPYGNLNNIYPLPANDSIYKITYPIAQYDHDEGNAISGGYEYSGITISLLEDKFLFGDIPSGRLFYINFFDIHSRKPVIIEEWTITLNGVATTLKKLCQSDRVDLHFGKDAYGELYIMTKADGKLYKLQRATMKNSEMAVLK